MRLPSDNSIEIVPMLPEHWTIVSRIYLEGLNTGNATFETTVPSWDHWNESHHQFARLVVLRDDEVLGWAALSPVSKRAAYAGVAEVSVYVGTAAQGLGCGRALLTALITAADQGGIWTLQAGIFPENTASIKLHQSCGFRVVGVRERIGKLNGTWRDTVLLERRNNID